MADSYSRHHKKIILIQKNFLFQKEPQRPSPGHCTKEKNYRSHIFSLRRYGLDEIIEINQEELFAFVEPFITIETLVKALMKQNLVPLVVPEFKKITVGGAIMGASLESSSFLYGQFNDSCFEYELLLGNNQIIVASQYTHQDLFEAISGSLGSLALLLGVKMRLKKALPYVELSLYSFSSKEAGISFLKSQLNRSFEYVEAILFSKEKMRVICGKMVEYEANDSYLMRLKPWSHWFYALIENYPQDQKKIVISTLDYLFRYDKGAFWMASYFSSFSWLIRFVFKAFLKSSAKTPSFKKSPWLDRILSFTFGWYLTSANLYKYLKKIPTKWFENHFVVQDFYVPMEKSNLFISDVEKYQLFPVWICPIKSVSKDALFAPHASVLNDYFLDVGVYSKVQDLDCATHITEALEKKLILLGGKKMLYASSYYSKDQLFYIYDKARYEELREKYWAKGVFVDFEDKVLRSFKSIKPL